MNLNKDLQEYIIENILPSYEKNDLGHNLDHINYVIKRSFTFAKTIPNIDLNMVYTVACYHDIGHYINRKKHEIISAEILRNDENLNKFFSVEQINIMSEAIEDHRASLVGEPRNIYGKILSSADRNVCIDVIIRRTYLYIVKHFKDMSIEEIILNSKKHILEKYGKNGYANKKIYFKDKEFDKFLKEVNELLKDEKKFKEIYVKINNLEGVYYER